VTWIILAVISTVLLASALKVFPRVLVENRRHEERTIGLRMWEVGIYVAGFFGSLLLFSVHIIPSGEVGVVRTFGNITGQVDEGLQFTWPWQNVEKWNIKLQTVLPESSCSNGSENCMDSFSSETQDVFVGAVVNLRVDPQDVQTLARTVGANYVERLVLPRLHQIVKDTTVRYESVDIAPAREDIRQTVRDRLGAELAARSINVDDLLITNIDFRPEFKQAIEDKVRAEQEALTEKNKVEIEIQKAEQEKQRGIAQANYLTETARGQAEANRLLNASLTPLVVQFKAIEKLGDNIQIALIPSGQGIILDPTTLFGGVTQTTGR
jgi:prohibitin 2